MRKRQALYKLFNSQARVEVLKILLLNPSNKYYQNQIVALTGLRIRSIQNEVRTLYSIGLLQQFEDGNRIYYQADKKSPLFEPLKYLLFRCVGIAAALVEAVAKKKNIDIAFVYGSYAKGDEDEISDIDLMVIGKISPVELSSLLWNVKKEYSREINYVVYSPKEFMQKVLKKEHFISSVLSGKKIFIIGDEDELGRLAERKQDSAA